MRGVPQGEMGRAGLGLGWLFRDSDSLLLRFRTAWRITGDGRQFSLSVRRGNLLFAEKMGDDGIG
jgi:hypothetical protein